MATLEPVEKDILPVHRILLQDQSFLTLHMEKRVSWDSVR